MSTISFNAHYAPVGAFATFILSRTEARGGTGLELGGCSKEVAPQLTELLRAILAPLSEKRGGKAK